ncbi:hypothetical protein J3L18_10740 [Mucilaginibacter gossypii]|uniref:hypothetical protein n=1 Tax=Mucilaginibacter gossypii TaxID=551996 RepID=UPI000DCB857A|nr:hypothetical protein [Mucilaginibacter gossypii]QTE39503.1 hypothetical protein J3L18_10740 [Mucilaginibacter gossypii]RAV56136.1 hypothetical protein DIU36_15385 [Mucilaginibacter rubeus]
MVVKFSLSASFDTENTSILPFSVLYVTGNTSKIVVNGSKPETYFLNYFYVIFLAGKKTALVISKTPFFSILPFFLLYVKIYLFKYPLQLLKKRLDCPQSLFLRDGIVISPLWL